MRIVPLSICGLVLFGVGTPTAAPLPNDVANIENLAGCFEVTYRFVEDGEHDSLRPDYALEDPITEWLRLSRPDENTFVLLHVSITGDGRTVPHFHEIWRFDEARSVWRHEIRRGAEGEGESVLRYACTADWVLNLWQCHAGRAEKPFRDSGAPFGFDRQDYDWIDRHNEVLATPRGWVHSEFNRKMTDDDTLVAYELGWITYKRIDDAQCAPAKEAFPLEVE